MRSTGGVGDDLSVGKLPEGRRRAELEQTGHQFLASLRCEPVPEQAGDFYAAVKLARQQRGLTLGATLVSRDSDFAGIDGLAVVALN